MRIGHGYDVHRLTDNRKLILGGVEIPFEKGLLGHSDADVLTHAVMDALLGAAAMGDIGKLFPDSDPAYKGADRIIKNRLQPAAGSGLPNRQHRRDHSRAAAKAVAFYRRHAPDNQRSLRDAFGGCQRQSHH